MKVETWHRSLMVAVERATPALRPSVRIVARVLADMSKSVDSAGLVFGGADAVRRRTATYRGGVPLADRTVWYALSELRRRGLIRAEHRGGGGRLRGAARRGGRGDANGYELGTAAAAPWGVIHRLSTPPTTLHKNAPLSAPRLRLDNPAQKCTPESETTSQSHEIKDRAAVKSTPRKPDLATVASELRIEAEPAMAGGPDDPPSDPPWAIVRETMAATRPPWRRETGPKATPVHGGIKDEPVTPQPIGASVDPPPSPVAVQPLAEGQGARSVPMEPIAELIGRMQRPALPHPEPA